jgi:hypothetical protein
MIKNELIEHLRTHINNYTKHEIIHVSRLIENDEITTIEQIDEKLNNLTSDEILNG